MSVGFCVTFGQCDKERLLRSWIAGCEKALVAARSAAACSRGSPASPTATAITAVRVATRKATQDGLSMILARIVEESILEAGEEVRWKTILKLNQHQRVVFEILESEGPLIQRELYERYSEDHADPVTLRYLWEKHLPKLEHYGLVETERNGSGMVYTLA